MQNYLSDHIIEEPDKNRNGSAYFKRNDGKDGIPNPALNNFFSSKEMLDDQDNNEPFQLHRD